MLSKRSLFSVLLFSLAQADSVCQNKSASLSFGPPSTHSTFDTSPLNPRRRLFGDNVNDQTTVLALAKWYIEHILHHPEDSWRVTENRTRQDPSTGVWRVDFKQVARNGTIEIVDGNLSLNILNGEVISYGDSFYRGSQPDFYATNCDSPFGCTDYTLQSYCSTIGDAARQVWMQENPKWAEWFNQCQRLPKRARDKLFERREHCQANIEKAIEKCIQEHTNYPAVPLWLRKAWVWWRVDVLKDHSTDVHGYVPPECASLQTRIPLDFSVPTPFKKADSFDEDSCSWTFTTDFTTTSAHLYSIRQSHCDISPRTESSCGSYDYSSLEINFRPSVEVMELMYKDASEIMETEGIMNPAIAAISLVVSLPYKETAFNWDAIEDARSVLRKIESRRRPEDRGYDFELKNVPGADGPVNATLVYVQTPLRRSPGLFNIDDDDDSETHPTSSLTLAWKLPITFTNSRKFEGYVKAKGGGGLVRLLHLSVLGEQPQNLPALPPPDALESLSNEVEHGESCFGWGESAAIRAGAKEFLQNEGLSSDGGKTESSLKRGAATKPLTYRSLDAPFYWGTERMANVWAEILRSVHQSIITHSGDDDIVSDCETPSNPNHGEDAPEMPKETILASLIPSSLALLPCNPTFIMARDALIQAGQVVFGGKYACAMWKGFAGKGLGINAQAAAERMLTPWGGGKRKDGFDVPEECESTRREGERRDE